MNLNTIKFANLAAFIQQCVNKQDFGRDDIEFVADLLNEGMFDETKPQETMDDFVKFRDNRLKLYDNMPLKETNNTDECKSQPHLDPFENVDRYTMIKTMFKHIKDGQRQKAVGLLINIERPMSVMMAEEIIGSVLPKTNTKLY